MYIESLQQLSLFLRLCFFRQDALTEIAIKLT
ncbi:Uncharacterised protein [Vibrio cholerae]|nr:Uncharacterised protein [Vibrio cholerae]